jgi:hypothetical protein
MQDLEYREKPIPDPRRYPALWEILEKLRATGYPVAGLRAKPAGCIKDVPQLRIELPLDANLKQYLPAMQACQEYFLSTQSPDSLVRYVADEHGAGRKYSDLADELNEATLAWAYGERTKLNIVNLDAFLKARGYTPEQVKRDYEKNEEWPWDAEKVTRLVKYFVTGK